MWWLFAIFISFLSCSFGIVTEFSKTSSSAYASYVQSKFGLGLGGEISISYSFTQTDGSGVPSDAYVLLLLLTDAERVGYFQALDNAGGTTTDFNTVSSLCVQPSLQRVLITSNSTGYGTFNVTIDRSYRDDLYSVVILQCRNLEATSMTLNSTVLTETMTSQLSLDAHVYLEMTNAQPYSTARTQLAIQQVNYLRVFQGETILYAALLVGIVAQIFLYKSSTKQIHYLFAATVFLNLILVILNYSYYSLYDKHGSANLNIEIASDIFYAISDTLALSTIFLLSLGWTFLRGQLTSREKKLVFYSVTCYFTFAMGSAVCLDGESSICIAISLVSFILRNLLLLAIIVAMNFTVTQLRILLVHSPWVPSTPVQYARCKQFLIFRLVYIVFLFMPTVIYIIDRSTFSWKEASIVLALNEFVTIAMMFHIGVTFSPLQEHMLLRAFDGSLDGGRAE